MMKRAFQCVDELNSSQQELQIREMLLQVCRTMNKYKFALYIVWTMLLKYYGVRERLASFDSLISL